MQDHNKWLWYYNNAWWQTIWVCQISNFQMRWHLSNFFLTTRLFRHEIKPVMIIRGNSDERWDIGNGYRTIIFYWKSVWLCECIIICQMYMEITKTEIFAKNGRRQFYLNDSNLIPTNISRSQSWDAFLFHSSSYRWWRFEPHRIAIYRS